MIDSLFVLGEDKQIVIEKHWKQTVDRSVLEPFYVALRKYVDSDVRIYIAVYYPCRISHQFWKVMTMR